MKRVLVTGMAGFIGYHLSKLLKKEGYEVVGIDNLNDYYDPTLKLTRLENLGINTDTIEYNKPLVSDNCTFYKVDLTDLKNLKSLFERYKFEVVIHLAAQAGVRYSIVNPQAYVDSNITGFLNVLESCKAFPVKHLIFASSSSVYGLSEDFPFKEDNSTDHPISMYAATKKSNEMMAHSYANLYSIPCTGLRFFTVYGPLGRPDMAYYIFTKAMLEGKEFEVFNQGQMSRDFTYVDDIVESIKRLMPLPPKKNNPAFDIKKPTSSKSTDPYQIFNIGNNKPVALMDYIDAIEKAVGVKGKINLKPMQSGDVVATYADVSSLFEYIDFKPTTSVEDGIAAFVKSYKEYILK